MDKEIEVITIYDTDEEYDIEVNNILDDIEDVIIIDDSDDEVMIVNKVAAEEEIDEEMHNEEVEIGTDSDYESDPEDYLNEQVVLLKRKDLRAITQQ